MRRGAAALLAAGAAGHGGMTRPAARNGATSDGWPIVSSLVNAHCWFTDAVEIPGEPTLPAAFGTTTGRGCGRCKVHTGAEQTSPWRAPGSALSTSPCGNNWCGDGGKMLPSGTDVRGIPDGRKLPAKNGTIWKAGTAVEVAFGLFNNHGGGYSYRLCPAGEDPTEACFQRGHLQFAENTTVIRFNNCETNGCEGRNDCGGCAHPAGSEAVIPAQRLTVGTVPAGSMWSVNPIPNNEVGAPFGPPCSGCVGEYGAYEVVDKVVLPSGLAPGDYLLSWRWDCDSTPQVWFNCADVTITAGAAPVAPTPFPTTAPGVCAACTQPDGGECCDPSATPMQRCPNGDVCCDCGSAACQCPV